MSKKSKIKSVNCGDQDSSQPSEVQIVKKPKPKKVDQALALTRIQKQIDNIEPEYSKWEDLEGIYVECAKGVIDIAQSVNHTYESFKQHPEIPIPHGAATAIRGISKDLSHLTDELIKIHNDHRGLQGPINTDEDFSRSVSITQDYIGFQERFKTAILPPLSVISEALIKRADLIKKQEENEITEIAPKDPQ